MTVLLGDPSLPDFAKPRGTFTPEDLEAVERLKQALARLGGHAFSYLTDHRTLIDELRRTTPSFALNFCDTGYRNEASLEPHVPALLELLDVPYSGAGPACLALCYDKAAVRAIAQAHGVPVPTETFIAHDEAAPDFAGLPFPALLKPATGDGSVGIGAESVARDADDAAAALALLRRKLPGRDVLAQEFLPGDEFAVGLIGNPGGFQVLPLLEVDYDGLDPALPRILAYESKTVAGSSYWTGIRYREASLDEPSRRRLVEWCTLLFERLGCRDYARFDFRRDAGGEPRLLEVNPNPAWCWDGKMNLMAGFGGTSYHEFLGLVLAAALRRTGAPHPAPAPSA